jgi:hypothetical protein
MTLSARVEDEGLSAGDICYMSATQIISERQLPARKQGASSSAGRPFGQPHHIHIAR